MRKCEENIKIKKLAWRSGTLGAEVGEESPQPVRLVSLQRAHVGAKLCTRGKAQVLFAWLARVGRERPALSLLLFMSPA